MKTQRMGDVRICQGRPLQECDWIAGSRMKWGLSPGSFLASARTCALLAFTVSTLWASGGGSLLGTVTDPRGATVPGAKVTATEAATAVTQTITTDGRGFYSFQSLPVGSYEVQVDARDSSLCGAPAS